jgi:ATP-dependent DNA helicase RecQ
MRDPKVFVHGFDRPNIYLRVDRFDNEDAKLEALVHRVNWAEKPGIVYVATRKNVQILTGALAEQNVNVSGYHGGMKASDRKEIQDKFMAGETDVIVATNAFGMGIDKSNVRFVYHYDISDSLDSHYQEIGRAGRDGEKAEAVLFYRPEDLGIRKFLSGESKVKAEEVEKVVEVIADQEGPVEPEEIADEIDLSNRKLAQVIHRLEDAGAVEVLPGGEVQVAEDTDPREAAEAAAEEQERHREMKRERIRLMQEYAETSKCRREQLLCYLGDEFSGPCNNCDNCEAALSRDRGDIEVDPKVGTRREVA